MADIPNGYDLNKMVQNHRATSAEEEKLVKEVLERTGYSFFIRNSKDLQDIAVEVEASEGFRTNSNLVRKGESAELVKNFLPVFGKAEDVPSDVVINGMMKELAEAFVPKLEGELQVLEQRISFYKDIVAGNVDIEKVRGYIAGVEEDTLDAMANIARIEEQRKSKSEQYDGTLESLARIAKVEEQHKKDNREFRPFSPNGDTKPRSEQTPPKGITADFLKKD